jgi:hypothetical protein
VPPRFSLRVASKGDLAALAFYGTAGLVLLRTSPARNRSRASQRRAAGSGLAGGPPGAELSQTLADLKNSEMGVWLRQIELSIPPDVCPLPCSRHEANMILRDVLTAASLIPGAARVSIYAGQTPGCHRLTVAISLDGSADTARLRTLGRRDEECRVAHFPGWPATARAVWFENGSDYIFQVSLKYA